MSSTKVTINVLIVDDEKEARINLENILKEYVGEGINIAGMAHNTKEAEIQINKFHPDAVFLDIEMPNENAFHFLERISPVNFEVIFVTAYDEYAIRAFKLNAVDYILKPLSISELAESIKKLREKINLRKLLSEHSTSYTDLLSQVSNKTKGHRITLRDNNIIEVVDFKDIYFVEAQGSYIRVMFLKDSMAKEIVMSGSLTDYEDLLPAEIFFRIHKSFLINCIHVKKILKGDYNQVVIHGPYTLPVSRRRYTPLIEFLKMHNYYNE
jgi:two-component system LytT family response regulator